MTKSANNELLTNVLNKTAMLLCDGAMGSSIQRAGLWNVHKIPDILNITHPNEILKIQSAYVDAGSQMIITNTFNTNAEKLAETPYTVAEIYSSATRIARESGAEIVGGDIGPCGLMIEPFGDTTEEDAYELFSQNARAIEESGCDLVILETFTDLNEVAIAAKAALDKTPLPVFVSMSFVKDGMTLFGNSIEDAAKELTDLGVSAFGANCSLGPSEFVSMIERARNVTDLPLIAQPNAGLPKVVDGETKYDMTPEEFAHEMEKIISVGATIVGGCCGTDPNYIRALKEVMSGVG